MWRKTHQLALSREPLAIAPFNASLPWCGHTLALLPHAMVSLWMKPGSPSTHGLHILQPENNVQTVTSLSHSHLKEGKVFYRCSVLRASSPMPSRSAVARLG
eukprot:4598058-Amphidinium_carterae.1